MQLNLTRILFSGNDPQLFPLRTVYVANSVCDIDIASLVIQSCTTFYIPQIHDITGLLLAVSEGFDFVSEENNCHVLVEDLEYSFARCLLPSLHLDPVLVDCPETETVDGDRGRNDLVAQDP